MSLQIILTADNSHTLYNDKIKETYHSVNGAIEESIHVYIKNGFNEIIKNKSSVSVFEIGFGTGLNAILSFIEAKKNSVNCIYHSIESNPLNIDLINQLNYKKFIENNFHEAFDLIHESKWNEEINVSKHFILKKIHQQIENYLFSQKFDLVYFDAFAPNKQPELWNENILKKILECMHDEGILVTYSAKGEVRRIFQRIGFTVERIEGPKGKREMLRCKKISN